MGLSALALVLIRTPWLDALDSAVLLPTLMLVGAAILGEAKPIDTSVGPGETRSLSMSTPFVLALVAVSGGVALVAQVAASLTDDIVNRRDVKKSLFNVAQYSISVFVARVVYALLAGVPLFEGHAVVGTAQIAPLMVAGIAMVTVNWVLVAAVVSIASSQPFRLSSGEDVRTFISTNLMLLPTGGIAAMVADDGAIALVLLAAPVVAAHMFAAASAKHAHAVAHDSLTGLGNRGAMESRVRHALKAAREDELPGPGLVLIDLDHFKDINDTLGHSVGDTILQEVAQRLVDAAPDSVVHRLGGDEFAVVIDGDLRAAQRAANGLLASLDEPVLVEGLEILVRASAGIAVAPEHGHTSELLMKHADIALYRAKRERDGISVFDYRHDVNSVETLQLLAELRTALEHDQLRVVYQPQVNLRTGRMVAVEALVRWDHPARAKVGPDKFIPLAENSGLIFPLTAFVLDTSLAQIAQWRKVRHDLRLSVNLSARHLSDLSLPQQISNALDKHGVPASALVLEITETGILSDAVRADVVIRAIRAIGVEVAIDDYGTGNASLNYLKNLEVDELKVDRTFVGNIHSDRHDHAIVAYTVELALDLGLRVVAEGIEDERTAELLREMGEVIGQGHHLGRPVPPHEIVRRLALESERTSWSPRES
ncbi:putative bifunctional diguanylate cyclase/phosphodiesterase [Demequina salsinemoris]|uniref:putative bifunctional diguanylate cyclase/phosphodiesterase n=1 Tax=Demequina salsinemoris TaxID=577470 RepID=UPI000781CD2D|nr:EAL domain-containing protein [Demequina salsinemoris]